MLPMIIAFLEYLSEDRSLMQDLSKDDFSKENFKFATSRYISIDNMKIWTQRLSYVGELGYELYIKVNDARKVYNLIIEKGSKYKISNCGMHSMDTMRMESGFLHCYDIFLKKINIKQD